MHADLPAQQQINQRNPSAVYCIIDQRKQQDVIVYESGRLRYIPIAIWRK